MLSADQEAELGSMGSSWAERKVAHPRKLSRPSLSGLFSGLEAAHTPRENVRSNPVFEADSESGKHPPCQTLQPYHKC